MKESRIATSEEFGDYSELHKVVYGYRPRPTYDMTVGEIEAFHSYCYQEAKPVTLDDGTVRMVSEPQPWLAEKWEAERAIYDEWCEEEKWEEAVFNENFSVVKEEIDSFLNRDQKPLVRIEIEKAVA